MLICAQRLLMSLEFPVTAYPSPISFHIDYTSSCFRVEATPLISLSSNSFCPSDLPAHSIFLFFFFFSFFAKGQCPAIEILIRLVQSLDMHSMPRCQLSDQLVA